jgi:hypothetical protein
MRGIEQLKGKILTAYEIKSDEILFTDSEGVQYRMYHSQDCCESVTLEDVVGDMADLLDSPILEAEEVTSSEDPEGTNRANEYRDSYTWTFYKIGTIRGRVTIRWYGESNGYYSETAQFVQVGSDDDY